MYKYQSTYIQALPPLWDMPNYYYMYSLSYGSELIRPIRYRYVSETSTKEVSDRCHTKRI